MLKRLKGKFRYGEKGFTMIELLVAIALLGVLAAVAIPNLGKFIGQGKTESYAAELHNVQTGVMAMLVDSTTGVLDGAVGPTDDMKTVVASGNSLDSYLAGLTTNGTIKSGCSYTFTTDGTVTQTPPA